MLVLLLFISFCFANEISPLLLNHIQVKSTHNSYHIRPNLYIPEWDYNHLHLSQQLEIGVRHFEFDLYYDDKTSLFQVKHLLRYDNITSCTTLVTCLSLFANWWREAAFNGGSPILFFSIHPRGSEWSYEIWNKFDTYIKKIWDFRDDLLTPDFLRTEEYINDTLQEFIFGITPTTTTAPTPSISPKETEEKNNTKMPLNNNNNHNYTSSRSGIGWPILEIAAGRVMFIIEENYKFYLQMEYVNLNGRVAFPAFPYTKRFHPQAIILTLPSPILPPDLNIYSSLDYDRNINIEQLVVQGYMVRASADARFPTHLLSNQLMIDEAYFKVIDQDRSNSLDMKELIEFINITNRTRYLEDSFLALVNESYEMCLSTNESQAIVMGTEWNCLQSQLQITPLLNSYMNLSQALAMQAKVIRSGAHWVTTDYPDIISAGYEDYFLDLGNNYSYPVVCNPVSTVDLFPNCLPFTVNQAYVRTTSKSLPITIIVGISAGCASLVFFGWCLLRAYRSWSEAKPPDWDIEENQDLDVGYQARRPRPHSHHRYGYGARSDRSDDDNDPGGPIIDSDCSEND